LFPSGAAIVDFGAVWRRNSTQRAILQALMKPRRDDVVDCHSGVLPTRERPLSDGELAPAPTLK